MTHAELVEAARKWLRRPLVPGRPACYPVVTELTTSSPEIMDAIGWYAGGSVVVECKVSRRDFRREMRKAHASWPESGMGAQRYYLCPAHLLTEVDIPPHCGLLWYDGKRIVVMRQAPYREVYDFRNEQRVLRSLLRRAGVKT